MEWAETNRLPVGVLGKQKMIADAKDALVPFEKQAINDSEYFPYQPGKSQLNRIPHD